DACRRDGCYRKAAPPSLAAVAVAIRMSSGRPSIRRDGSYSQRYLVPRFVGRNRGRALVGRIVERLPYAFGVP
ncbi:MAG: hypothetical protein WD423_03930, partial [Rhodothermales bacterium]